MNKIQIKINRKQRRKNPKNRGSFSADFEQFFNSIRLNRIAKKKEISNGL